jgi:ubiquinone/menaquinone biosynthesis C-methylase UbiE
MFYVVIGFLCIASSIGNPANNEHIATAASIFDQNLFDADLTSTALFASLVLSRATWTSKNGDSETEFLLRHVGITPTATGETRPGATRRRLANQGLYEDGEPKHEERVQGQHVLDFGYGAGHMTRLLRRSLDSESQVHGIEISKAQAARANLATVKTNLAPGIAYGTHLGFGELPYRDHFFSHVLSQQAFSHCPDRVATFKEIFRVLQPGGQLAFQDIFLSRAKGIMLHTEPVQQAFGSVMGSIRDYKKDLIAAGFVDIQIESIFDLAENIDVQKHLTQATKTGMFTPSDARKRHPELFVLSVEDNRLQYGDVAVANALANNALALGIVKVRKPTLSK